MIKINYNENGCDCSFKLNNEHYDGELRMCTDPLCTCTDINLTFREMNDMNKVFSFDIDLLERKISKSKNKKTHPDLSVFEEKFLTELSNDDWILLHKIFIKTKITGTEKCNPEKINADFPWQDIEKNSLMISYLDIFPYGE